MNPVRIAIWNCCGGGSTKLATLIERFQPDVAVLPEYGVHPKEQDLLTEGTFLGAGVPGEKGLAVVALGEYSLTMAALVGPFPATLLPVEVRGPLPFRLLAVWANLGARPETHPVVEFVGRYPDWCSGGVVVGGDFNTGGIDKWKDSQDGLNHYRVLEALGALGLRSAYHHSRGIEQGPTEPDPTFWMSRHADKAFHIDHVFAPMLWPVRSVTVGSFKDWNEQSDHAPMVVEFG